MVMPANSAVQGLLRVSQLDSSLAEENLQMRTLSKGMASCMISRQPVSVALYIYRMVSSKIETNPHLDMISIESVTEMFRGVSV